MEKRSYRVVTLPASTAPAEAARLADVGSLQVGKCADIVILDKDLNLKAVFVDGQKI